MKLELSPFKHLIEKKISFPYWDFYFCNNLIISEIAEGVSFKYEQAKPVIGEALAYFGEDAEIAYLSNRIHSYALAPQDWLKFFGERKNIKAMAIVAYSELDIANIILEKLFIKTHVKRHQSLAEGLHRLSERLPIIQFQKEEVLCA